ncbi:MAG: hypothetical protein ABDK94_03955 [Atribacterota bacterium]
METRLWILLVLCLSLFSGCFGPKTVTFGEAVRLFHGGAVILKESGISIKFLEVIEDSRCPDGGICPWEGRVVVWLAIQKGQRWETREIILQPSRLPHEEDIDGFLLIISDFGPPKKLGQDILSSQYFLILSLRAG